MFPTHVGVNRQRIAGRGRYGSVPHARGGEPRGQDADGLGPQGSDPGAAKSAAGADLCGQARADYLDNCRSKRNLTDYDRAGEIAEAEAEEILAEARAFRAELLEWLRANHPELLPGTRQ